MTTIRHTLAPLCATSLALVASLAAAACTGSPEDVITSGVADVEVMIVEPARGTRLEHATEITVRGFAWARTGRPTVRVADRPVVVAADGSFSMELPIGPGLASIETVVSDDAGNQVRDLRAVLTGETRSYGEEINDAVVSYVGRDAFADASEIITGMLTDEVIFHSIAAGNPVADVGYSCLGAKVHVVRVDLDALDVRITPQAGGLHIAADAYGLDLGLDVFSNAACVDFEHQIPFVASRASIDADLNISLRDGKIQLALGEVLTEIVDMDFDTSVLDAAVAVGLDAAIESSISDALAVAVTEQIEHQIEPMLRDLETEPFLLDTLGQRVEVAMSPRELAFASDGVRFAASVAVRFPDHPEIEVHYSPATMPLADLESRPGGLQLAVSDDIVNQFLSALWSTRALEMKMPIDDETAARFNIDHIAFEPLLPPIVEIGADQVARVSIGDCMARIIDEAGNVVAEAAISGSLGLKARIEESGQVISEVLEPQVAVALIGRDGKTTNSAHLTPALNDVLLAQLTPAFNEAVAAMPKLRMQNVTLPTPAIDGRGGYLLVGADLSLAE